MVKMARSRRPIFKADSKLIGAIARRHPFGLSETQIIKKQFQELKASRDWTLRKSGYALLGQPESHLIVSTLGG